MLEKNVSNPIKIYLPKTQFNSSELKSSSLLHYLYGFSKSSSTNDITEIYINEMTVDQKQIYSTNKLLGSLEFNQIKPSRTSHVAHLLFEIKIQDNSFVLSGRKVNNRDFFIIFYDGQLSSQVKQPIKLQSTTKQSNETNWLKVLDSFEATRNALNIFSLVKHCLFDEVNCLKKRARLYSILLNLIFGILISLCICIDPYFGWLDLLKDTVFSYMEVLMDLLSSIINWLMGVPVGLKLNKPLNEFLGRFFLYHIYLWNSSLEVFRMTLPILIQAIIYSGFFGLSFMVSMCLDVFRILTIHNYCFYIYALRVYKIEMESLKSLFRLFRGKKLNPLRARIDSYSYNVEQLFIGTLSFCIVFFLFPTIFMYYIVFLSLRVVCLIIEFTMKCLIISLNSIPIYEVTVFFSNTWIIRDKQNYSINNRFKSNRKYTFLELKYVKKGLGEILEETENEFLNLPANNLKETFSDIFNGSKI